MKHSGNIALVISLALAIFVIAEKFKSSAVKRIGVVQMDKLVYEFKGMKDATKTYSAKIKEWDSQTDSLQSRLQKLFDQIRMDSLSHNQGKLEKDVRTFMILKRSYVEFLEKKEENAKNEDTQMTLGVVNQVKEYIKIYSEERGYDVVLCNSEQQTIGHVNEQVDITKDVLEFANNKYDGVK